MDFCPTPTYTEAGWFPIPGAKLVFDALMREQIWGAGWNPEGTPVGYLPDHSGIYPVRIRPNHWEHVDRYGKPHYAQERTNITV